MDLYYQLVVNNGIGVLNAILDLHEMFYTPSIRSLACDTERHKECVGLCFCKCHGIEQLFVSR